jgi:hypothetical protein
VDNKEVVEIIQAGLAWADWTDKQREAFIIAGEAVRKQMLQRVIKIEGVSSQACPTCKSNVNGKYCWFCGQKLRY